MWRCRADVQATRRAPRSGVKSCAVTDVFPLSFYDLCHERKVVPRARVKLLPLLDGIGRSILEIGAGTGLITTLLADLTPADIFALEPAPEMRALLLSRLSSRPELLDRVTVLRCDAMGVRLDEPAEAAVMINVLSVLEPDYRARLWPVLADSLQTGGLLIFNWWHSNPPARKQRVESSQVGRHTYSVVSEVVDSYEEAYRTHYIYRVTEGSEIVAEEQATIDFYRPHRHVLERELTGAGFTQADGAEGLLAWRRA